MIISDFWRLTDVNLMLHCNIESSSNCVESIIRRAYTKSKSVFTLLSVLLLICCCFGSLELNAQENQEIVWAGDGQVALGKYYDMCGHVGTKDQILAQNCCLCSKSYTVVDNNGLAQSGGDRGGWLTFKAPSSCKIRVSLNSCSFASRGGQEDKIYISQSSSGSTGTSTSGSWRTWTNNTNTQNPFTTNAGYYLTIYFSDEAGTSAGGSTFSINVECVNCPPPRSASISGCPDTDVVSGSTVNLTGSVTAGSGDATWSSSDNDIATVNESGEVTALAPGVATITYNVAADGTYCDVSESCDITVVCDDSKTFGFTSSGGNVRIGGSANISGLLSNNTGQTVSWSSSDESVATVSSSGVVAGISEGSATITAEVDEYTDEGVTYCAKSATYIVTANDGCAIIGDGSYWTTSGVHGGIYTSTNAYAYTQQLYTASELNAQGASAGKISNIALHYKDNTSKTYTFEIYLGESNATAVPNLWITNANLTLVYSGTKTFTSANGGWNDIDISGANWQWDGTSNVVVAIRRTQKNASNDQANFYHNRLSSPYRAAYYNSNNAISLNANKIPGASGSQTNQRPDIRFCTTDVSPMPIRLTSFKANCDGTRANIEWETATEHNNDYFLLERSDNATYFNEIARVSGAGNSIEARKYSYTDYNAEDGDVYYRLWQVDYDGTRTASEIIHASCKEDIGGHPDFFVYPNPFSDELSLVLQNFGKHSVSVEVYDMLGRLILFESYETVNGRNEIVLQLGDLQPSAYCIRIRTDGYVLNKQVMKR